MKIQVTFDVYDIDKALDIAAQIHDHVHFFQVSTLLLYRYGIKAIEAFKQRFPDKPIIADTKIVYRAKEIVQIMSTAQADWVTVMAGTQKDIIQSVCNAAYNAKMKVMLDLLDSTAPGQSAMEAKIMGVNALLLHRTTEDKEPSLFAEKWEMIRGNTELPIFIAGAIDRDNIDYIISLQPEGIVLGSAIIKAENPVQEATFFATKIAK